MNVAEEQWGDPDDFVINRIKQYGGMSGYDAEGNQWELRIYCGEDRKEGYILIEIKGVKLWYELRLKANLPPLPFIPPFPSIEDKS